MCDHNWELQGGTACSYSSEEGMCSRMVYSCTKCGDCDYGCSRGADDECSICPYRKENVEAKESERRKNMTREERDKEAIDWFLRKVSQKS